MHYYLVRTRYNSNISTRSQQWKIMLQNCLKHILCKCNFKEIKTCYRYITNDHLISRSINIIKYWRPFLKKRPPILIPEILHSVKQETLPHFRYEIFKAGTAVWCTVPYVCTVRSAFLPFLFKEKDIIILYSFSLLIYLWRKFCCSTVVSEK